MKPTSNRIRFSLIIDSFEGGGAQRMMVNLANWLSRKDYIVDLLVARKAGPYISAVDDGVNVVDLGQPRVFLCVRALSKYLRARRPDCLLSAMTNVNLLALWGAWLSGTGTRVVISERNHLSTASREAESWRKRTLLPWLVRQFYPFADAAVGISDGVVDDLRAATKIGREKLVTIYNPVVTAGMQDVDVETPSEPWFDPAVAPVIVAIGRLVPQKDYPTLLHAFAKLRERRPCRLLILGEGPDRSEIEQLVMTMELSQDVQLPGFVHDPHRFLGRASLLVLSSAWEGFGNVIVEALAMGCPVVSTDCPSGPAEILDHGNYGRLVPVGDAIALAQAMEQTLDAPRDPARLRRRALKFTVEAIGEQYLHVLLGKRR